MCAGRYVTSADLLVCTQSCACASGFIFSNGELHDFVCRLVSYYFFYDMVAGKYMCIELCPFVFSLELIRLYGREVWSDMGFLVVWLVVVCGLHVLNAVLDVVLW